MLKPRTLILLAAAVVVLGGISFLQRARHDDTTNRSATAVVVDGEFSAEDLGRITLGRGDTPEAVVLESADDGWTVTSVYGVQANLQRVEDLLRNLSNLRGEFRSDKADVLADYGLDAAGAVVVRGYDKAGTRVLALDVGRSPERFPGNFIRNPDDTRVYVSRASVLNTLGVYGEPELPGARHFLELQAVTVDRLAVNAIALRDSSGDRTLAKVLSLTPPAEDAPEGTEPTVDRTTWEWKLDDGTALAKTKADAVLGAAVSIRAVDVGDPTAAVADFGLDTPARSATLELEDGTVMGLEFGHSREALDDAPAGIWMKVRGRSGIWLVTDYTVNNIFKPTGDLLPE